MTERQSAPNFQEVVELTRLYGSAAGVPIEDLDALGYIRTEDGTLAPKTVYDERQASIVEKRQLVPFEPFSIETETHHGFRSMSRELIERATAMASEIDIMAYDFSSFSDDKKRRKLLYPDTDRTELDFAVFWQQQTTKAFEYIGGSVHGEFVDFMPSTISYGDDLQGFITDHAEVDEFTLEISHMEGAQTAEVATKVELLQGKATDEPELKGKFNELFHQSLDEVVAIDLSSRTYQNYDQKAIRYDDFNAEVEDCLEQLKTMGISTVGKFLMLTLGYELASLFPEVPEGAFVAETLALNGFDKAADYLNRLKSYLTEQKLVDLKNAKKHLASVPFGSEGRTAAEAQLASAKKAVNQPARMLDKFINEFDRPKLMVSYFNKRLKALKDILYTKNDSERTFTFVADIDERLDRNPGIVSGDCTVDAPLPFLSSKNGLYNVKVFNNNDHVGNIYLLQALDANGDPVGWHLDAIQIPINTDWEAFSSAFIESLTKAAKSKNIHWITINGEDIAISNYDYIRDAFESKAKRSIDRLSPRSEDDALVMEQLDGALKIVSRTTLPNRTTLQAQDQEDYLRLM